MHYDATPFIGQRMCDGIANPNRAAGYERDAPIELLSLHVTYSPIPRKDYRESAK